MQKCVHVVLIEEAEEGGCLHDRMASQNRNMSIVGILQGTLQLKERHGEETAETIFNSCHDTITGAFGPLSQDVELISKLGSRAAQTGSVTTARKPGEQGSAQQMMGVPLKAPNELREMPKGDIVLLKTFCRSTKPNEDPPPQYND